MQSNHSAPRLACGCQVWNTGADIWNAWQSNPFNCLRNTILNVIYVPSNPPILLADVIQFLLILLSRAKIDKGSIHLDYICSCQIKCIQTQIFQTGLGDVTKKSLVTSHDGVWWCHKMANKKVLKNQWLQCDSLHCGCGKKAQDWGRGHSDIVPPRRHQSPVQ